jgi:hypothetical protein
MVLLTTQSGALDTLVKKLKSSKFYIKKNIIIKIGYTMHAKKIF